MIVHRFITRLMLIVIIHVNCLSYLLSLLFFQYLHFILYHLGRVGHLCLIITENSASCCLDIHIVQGSSIILGWIVYSNITFGVETLKSALCFVSFELALYFVLDDL